MHLLKNWLRKVRRLGTFWMAEQTLEHLKAIRLAELEQVLQWMPSGINVLEIGSGSGWQAQALSRRGCQVYAIDIPDSNYRGCRVWPVIDYDGKHIPFPAGSFDVVFSSNVMEHIPHFMLFQDEIRRVLKAGGIAVHLVPSSTWRFWTCLTHWFRYWTIPGPHGELAPNALLELRFYSAKHWVGLFQQSGWKDVAVYSNHLFYTGSSIADSRLSIVARRRLSRWAGSACHILVMRKDG